MKYIGRTLSLCLFLSTTLFGVEDEPEPPKIKQQYGYFSIGAGPLPVPLPNFGAGYRYQSGKHGVTVGVQTSTIVFLTEVKLNANYMRYFSPDLQQQTYFAPGVAVGGLFGSHYSNPSGSSGFISPDFIIGTEFMRGKKSRQFIEAEIVWPLYFIKDIERRSITNGSVFWFPCVIVSYGFGF